MIDPTLAVPETILEELRRQSAEHADVEAMLMYLSQQQLSAGRAKLALTCAGVMTLGEAKAAVHRSEAYAHGRRERERFENSMFEALDGDLNREKHAA